MADVLTVHYERKYSDGNYGSEGVSFSLTADTANGDVTSDVLTDHAEYLKYAALSFLAGSSSPAVRRAAQRELAPLPAEPMPDQEQVPLGDLDDEEPPF